MRGTLLLNDGQWIVEVWKDLEVTEYPLTPSSLIIRQCRVGLDVDFKLIEIEKDGTIVSWAKLLPEKPIVSDDFQIGPHGAFEMTDDMIEQRMKKFQGLHILAEESWEGCDGCTEEDANLWRNGFISGALELEPEWIDWDEAYAQYKGVSDLHDFIDWAKQNFNITKKD
jgi:hypothetical protein